MRKKGVSARDVLRVRVRAETCCLAPERRSTSGAETIPLPHVSALPSGPRYLYLASLGVHA